MLTVVYFFLALLLLAATIAFVAVAALLSFILFRVWRATAPETAQDLDQTDPMPKTLLAWINTESEQWARDDLRERARELRRHATNWIEVERVLKQNYGDTIRPPAEAAQEAWSTLNLE